MNMNDLITALVTMPAYTTLYIDDDYCVVKPTISLEIIDNKVVISYSTDEDENGNPLFYKKLVINSDIINSFDDDADTDDDTKHIFGNTTIFKK